MATAAAVSISAISRTNNVVTVVTSAAHGLAASQGFSISGVADNSLNINGTVASVASTTSFTFSQAGANASSSGGSVLPAKEAIILEISTGQPQAIEVRYALWLTTLIPVARPGVVSLWTGASAAENAAIAAGTTIEVVRGRDFPSTLTKAQIQGFLQAEFSAQQQYLQGQVQPGQFYGVFFDGTGWSA